MGDVTEMMLDGTLCSTCGEFVGSDAGHPVKCAGCREMERRARRRLKQPKEHETRCKVAH